MPLPSYEEAVRGQSVIMLVVTYLSVTSLAACCQVSKEWYEEVNPILWGDPIRIIAEKNRPFSRMVMFMKKWVEVAATRAVHTLDAVTTLDFRPMVALQYIPEHQQNYQIYENVMTVPWVFAHTKRFPNLRFINVSGLRMQEGATPFWQDGDIARPIQILTLSLSGLRMSPITVPAMEAFLNVFYLDISYTPSFPDFTRAYSTVEWPNLRVLKLRGMSLTDRAIPRPLLFHLWSLDVRDNLLTDQTIDMLLETCISVPLSAPSTSFSTPDENLFDFVPPYMRDPPTEEIYSRAAVVPLRPDDEEKFITYLRTNGHLAQHHRPVLDTSDPLIRQTGLTHLYISGNKLSSLGVQTLFRRTNRLQVLDVGSVRAVPPSYYNLPYHTPLSQPNTARFLSGSVALRLEILRLHHSVVTYTPTFLPSSLASRQQISLQHLHAMETNFGRDQARHWTAFSPLDNFRLRELTLTGVPTKSFGPVLCRLREFLALCAKQERVLAAARMGARHYRAPEVLSGLRVLRLEFADVAAEPGSSAVGFGSASVSGDRDADVFLEESRGDFSFFGDEREVVSRPGPVAALEASRRAVVERAERMKGPRVLDVVAGLKEFRDTVVMRWGGRLELVFPGRG